MQPQRVQKMVSVIDDYVDTAEACLDLRIQYDVDVREFVILACLKDSGVANTAEIACYIGLTPTTVMACLASLRENGLVRADHAPTRQFALTADALSLVRKASLHGYHSSKTTTLVHV